MQKNVDLVFQFGCSCSAREIPGDVLFGFQIQCRDKAGVQLLLDFEFRGVNHCQFSFLQRHQLHQFQGVAGLYFPPG